MEIQPGVKETKETLSLNVLLADDTEDIRELYKDLLEALGHKVKEVQDGQELLNELLKEGEKYDLVLSDNSMPSMQGIDVLKEIRSIEKLKKMPFILATSDQGDTLAKETEALNATFVSKPFHIKALPNLIETAMNKNKE